MRANVSRVCDLISTPASTLKKEILVVSNRFQLLISLGLGIAFKFISYMSQFENLIICFNYIILIKTDYIEFIYIV